VFMTLHLIDIVLHFKGIVD